MALSTVTLLILVLGRAGVFNFCKDMTHKMIFLNATLLVLLLVKSKTTQHKGVRHAAGCDIVP